MGDNKEFEVKAQTRKQGGNGTIQQMATESRSDKKKCPKRQPSIYMSGFGRKNAYHRRKCIYLLPYMKKNENYLNFFLGGNL